MDQFYRKAITIAAYMINVYSRFKLDRRSAGIEAFMAHVWGRRSMKTCTGHVKLEVLMDTF